MKRKQLIERTYLVIKAEIIKQQKHEFHSAFVWLSLLVWPILGFFEVYYAYKPFELTGYLGFLSNRDLLAFLGTGFMAYTCFWSMVQSAWAMSNKERTDGTLEITFLSSANRLAMNYGRALGSLIQEVWMFCCFCVFVLLYSEAVSLSNLWVLPLCLLLLLISSTVWGGMLNAVFLFSRDAEIVMNLIDTPMTLFSGSRIPIHCFPVWAKAIAFLFPLTYCNNIIRFALDIQREENGWLRESLYLAVCLATMIVITKWITFRAETHNRMTGELQFY